MSKLAFVLFINGFEIKPFSRHFKATVGQKLESFGKKKEIV